MKTRMHAAVVVWSCAVLLGMPAAARGQNPLHWLAPWRGQDSAAARGAAAERGGTSATSPDYQIGPGDVLRIDVWKEPEITQTEPVRPDGMISLPLIGSVRASGLTPAELGRQITTRLGAYVANPVVAVVVTQVVSRAFQVLGAVLRPGSYPLVTPTHVLQALAEAGGFTPFANRDEVVVLHWRADGRQERLQFNYSDVIHGKHLDEDRLLQPGDTLIVP